VSTRALTSAVHTAARTAVDLLESRRRRALLLVLHVMALVASGACVMQSVCQGCEACECVLVIRARCGSGDNAHDTAVIGTRAAMCACVLTVTCRRRLCAHRL
jgi:hypothetical protein